MSCKKNSMEWIRNWLLMCPLEHDIEVVRIFESHIGNDREYEFIYSWVGHWVGF